MLLTPDTSPRGAGVPGEADAWDFGVGAGFYLDATQAPWRRTGAWKAGCCTELLPRCGPHAPVPAEPPPASSATHGRPRRADAGAAPPGCVQQRVGLAPICAPMQCPWGVKAFSGYLGADRSAWAAHDATR
jgi:S-formylglutathione hydrolase